MMNRYLLFAGDFQYPLGGWKDFVKAFATVTEATNAPKDSYDWWHLMDGHTGNMIQSGGKYG